MIGPLVEAPRRYPDWISPERVQRAKIVCAGRLQLYRTARGTKVSLDGDGRGAVMQTLFSTGQYMDWSHLWCAEAHAELVRVMHSAINRVRRRIQLDAPGWRSRALQEMAWACVDAVCERLAPVERGAECYAPIAVLLGPRLRQLQAHRRLLLAKWEHGAPTFADRSAPRSLKAYTLLLAIALRWRGQALMHERLGVDKFYGHWQELSDQSLADLAAEATTYLHGSRRLLGDVPFEQFGDLQRLQDLSFAVAEAQYRRILPSADDLRVAWDLALARGLVRPGDRVTLAEVWARYVPLLREIR